MEMFQVNILIIGAGGREYSIGMALKKDKSVRSYILLLVMGQQIN